MHGPAVKHLTLQYSSSAQQRANSLSKSEPHSKKNSSISNVPYGNMTPKTSTVTLFYEALTIILKGDMRNFKVALITLLSLLKVKKISIESLLQSLTSRGVLHILRNFENKDNQIIRKLSALLIVEICCGNDLTQAYITELFSFTPIKQQGKIAINRLPKNLEERLKQEPASFLTELRQYLNNTPVAGVKYWSYPVQERPDRKSTPSRSITAEIQREASRFPDPLTHLVGIQVAASQPPKPQKSEKTKRGSSKTQHVKTHSVDLKNAKISPRTIPSQDRSLQLVSSVEREPSDAKNSQSFLLSRVAQQYTSRTAGDKSVQNSSRRAKSKSLHQQEEHSHQEDIKNTSHSSNMLSVKDTKKTKRGPSQQIQTVLDGSSGGSGFKQKAKGILGIRHSSRNSSIGSNQSIMSSERMRAAAQLEFGNTDKKPKSPRIPTLKIPLNSHESRYSSNKFRYDSKLNRNNLSVSTDRTYRYTGMSQLSPQKHQLLTKFFPTKSQLYSVLNRLNKPEMLLLKNLKRQYKDQTGESKSVNETGRLATQVDSNRTYQRQEESLLDTDGTPINAGIKINESLIERARPEDSFRQVRHEVRGSDRITKTKVINLRPHGLAINTKPKQTMQFRPNDTFNYMESVHKSPRVDHKISVSRNTGKPEYMVTKLTSEGYQKHGVYRTPPPVQKYQIYSGHFTPHAASTKTSPGISPESGRFNNSQLSVNATTTSYILGQLSLSKKPAQKYSDEFSSGKISIHTKGSKNRSTMYTRIYQNMFNKHPPQNRAATIYSKTQEKFRSKLDPRKDESMMSNVSHKPLNKSMRPAKPGGDKLNVSMQTQQSQSKEQMTPSHQREESSKVMDRLVYQINMKLKKDKKYQGKMTEPNQDSNAGFFTLNTEISSSSTKKQPKISK